MRRFLLLFEDQLYRWVLLSVLFLWAFVASIKIITLKKDILYISYGASGVSVSPATSVDDDVVFEKNFFRQFIMYFQNFDRENYRKNLDRASYLLSDELWKRVAAESKQAEEQIRKDDIKQSSVVTRITKVSVDQYEIITSNIYQIGKETEDRRYKVSLKVKRVERSELNPWGLEVIDVAQERLQ